MPETIATLAHEMVDLIIHAGKSSRGSIAILMAVAANPAGHMRIGQGSPTPKLSDFQKKKTKGTITAGDSRKATAWPRRGPPHAVKAHPRNTTRNQTKPNSPDRRA